MDEFIYKKSIAKDIDEIPFLERQILQVGDQEHGSYNGQIHFDCSGIQSSGRFVDWSQSEIQVPLVVSVQSSTDITSLKNAFMAGLKNGTHQLIDSLSVKINNTTVVEQQAFLNLFVSYKMMSTMSQDDLAKHGDLLLFSPDSARSSTYNVAASTDGSGTNNNAILGDIINTWADLEPMDLYNKGALQRFKQTSLNLATGFTVNGGNLGIDSVAEADQAGVNYFTDDGGAAAARVYQWNILATIRLKDLSDFFKKMPLVRGSYLRLTITYNSSRCVITGGTNTLVNTSQVMLSGNSTPYMVASGQANGSTDANAAVSGAVTTWENGILRTSISQASAHLTSCQLFVPSYVLDPVYEQQYLAANPMIDVVYRDLFSAQLNNVSTNFNSILTNGLSNPKSLVVMPFFNGTAGNNATLALNALQSPTSSEPATTGNRIHLDNWQVNISGKNLFDSSKQYDYDQFINEVSQSGLNGGLSTGLASGLVGMAEFQNNYRYYVADISRRFAGDKGAKSIRISGNNAHPKNIDLYAFVEYEKTIRINPSTGQIVSSVI